jgi:hypothetical protein
MRIEFDDLRGEVRAGDHRAECRRAGPPGAVRVGGDEGPVLRPVTFGERSAAAAAALPAPEPRDRLCAALTAMATVSKGPLDDDLRALVVLALAGADDERAPSFADTALRVLAATGGDLGSLLDAPALEVDRLAIAVQEQEVAAAAAAETGGWTRVEFGGPAPSLAELRRRLADHLLARAAAPASGRAPEEPASPPPGAEPPEDADPADAGRPARVRAPDGPSRHGDRELPAHGSRIRRAREPEPDGPVRGVRPDAIESATGDASESGAPAAPPAEATLEARPSSPAARGRARPAFSATQAADLGTVVDAHTDTAWRPAGTADRQPAEASADRPDAGTPSVHGSTGSGSLRAAPDVEPRPAAGAIRFRLPRPSAAPAGMAEPTGMPHRAGERPLGLAALEDAEPPPRIAGRRVAAHPQRGRVETPTLDLADALALALHDEADLRGLGR